MRYAPLVLLCIALPLHAEDLGLKVPPGFKVTLWADHTLANDIFTMALDEKGHVVVSGPGYVRLLEDTKGTGKADTATEVEKTKTGLMGLCYTQGWSERRTTILSGDGRLLQHERWPSVDGPDGKMVQTENALVKDWKFGEHGGHAVKFGPDNLLHAIVGNDGGLNKLEVASDSPIRSPEAGGILRFGIRWTSSPDVVAHGFRNPYDFDFTPYGDIITFDSDTERDYLLPWYAPTRVYHVLPGAHHGWRLTGYQRSLGRPDYYPDTVEMLADMGRGSPTGVCCYRHTQFPRKYRGGVFLADWTFGKISYMPLIPEGSSYKKVKPEVFLEATGSNGFAPTAMRVGPDGSLFISIGGRGTRGAVYKVEYLINGEARAIPPAEPDNNLDRVLNAPQPLEAWSIAKWKPIENDLDRGDLVRVAQDENESDERRIRAIEIVAPFRDWGTANAEAKFTTSNSALVRAAACWGMGRGSTDESWEVLREMMSDPSARVQVAALTALADRTANSRVKRPISIPQLIKNLGHEDHRVRLAATRLVVFLPDDSRRQLMKRASDLNGRALSSLVVAEAGPGGHSAEYFFAIARAIEQSKMPEERADLIRAAMIALGDWNLAKPGIELWSAYSLSEDKKQDTAYVRLVARRMFDNILANFPSTDRNENIEASRLLAMLQDDHLESVTKVLSQITTETHPTRDFHYLIVLTRLTAPRTEEQTRHVADALLGMEKKLAGRQLRIKQNWTARIGELVGELLRLHPGLDKLLAAHPELVQPGHVVVACKFTGGSRTEAASRFLNALKADAEFPLSAELIALIGELPREDVRTVLRARWSDRALRESIVRHLTDRPFAADRQRFLDVLETATGDTLQSCLDGLVSLPRDDSPKNMVPLIARLRMSFSDPKEKDVRRDLIGMLNRQAAQGFVIFEGKTDTLSLTATYRPVFEWFEKAHPVEAKLLNATSEDEAAVRALLPAAMRLAADVERGRVIFRDRGCQTCHGTSTRLGPDLAGVSKRLSHDDLLTAIVNPSRDVAPAYRIANIDLKNGKRISGIVVFESADGLLVQTGAVETMRIATEDIDSRTPSSKSLMPDGLLRGLKERDIADLFAFLARQ